MALLPSALGVLTRLGQNPVPWLPDDAAWVAAYRDGYAGVVALSGETEALHGVEELGIPGPAGEIPARLYRPAAGRLPVLLWFHGGGFIGGGLDTHDIPLRLLARRSGWAILSVAYRLAPEHPYPAAQEDCRAALDWLAGSAEALGLDAARLAVGGDSAGGLLAASVARMARDGGGPALRLQICLYPNTDLREDSDYDSLLEHDGAVVILRELGRGLDLYLPADADREDPLISPALAEDNAGLPPALVLTCEVDPLRDEGEAYADALRAAEVPVQHHRLKGMIHGALQMRGAIPEADAVFALVAEALAAA